MKNNILSLSELDLLTKSIPGKKVVLVGGCFDLLHWGHVTFLEKAKKQGDILVVMLESDEFIKKQKKRRHVHNQQQRAQILRELRVVDYVILLPYFSKDNDYSNLVETIKPDIIAVSEKDPTISKKKEQANKINAKIVVVTPLLIRFSSSVILPHADLSGD